MGWERVILPQLVKLINLFPDYDKDIGIPPNPGLIFGKDRKDTKDLSPNHWELGISSELLRSAAYGTELEWIKARDVYLYALDLHLNKIGLWTSEQYTGAPHGGFYLDALVATRMAVFIAKKNNPQFHSDASNLLLVYGLDEYTRRILSYLHTCSTENGEIVCCGERMPKGPGAPQQSAFYRELCGLIHWNARKINKQIQDDFWLSLRGLRKLIDAKDSIKSIMDIVRVSPLSLPFTSQEIILEKWSTGHLAKYANSTGGDRTCRWVWVDKEKIKWGTDTSQCPSPVKPFKEVTVPVPTPMSSDFSLWPASNHNWMAPGALNAVRATYGLGLDYGALRSKSPNVYEILVPKTPTSSSPDNSEWIPFDPKNKQLMLAANAFNRYGPGWSYGPGHNQHDEVIEYYREIYGRLPDDMEKLDIEHDRGMYQSLLKAYQDKIGFHPPTAPPSPPPVSPPVQPPIVVTPPVMPPNPPVIDPLITTIPQLANIEKRIEEVLSLIPSWVREMVSDAMLTVLIKEAIQTKRRCEDRIVQRVIEGLRKP